MIYENVLSSQECTSFVRCVKSLRTYHLDKQACARIDEDDPLVATLLRERITSCAMDQALDPTLKADREQRTEKLNSSMQERVELERSTPRWAKQGGYKDIGPLIRGDATVLGQSAVGVKELYEWKKAAG